MDRTLDEFQTGLTHVGLNQDHHWCFDTGHDDQDSAIQYKRPGKSEQSTDRLMRGDEEDDAGETTSSRWLGNWIETNATVSALCSTTATSGALTPSA